MLFEVPEHKRRVFSSMTCKLQCREMTTYYPHYSPICQLLLKPLLALPREKKHPTTGVNGGGKL